nr:uncharacterized protein LOC106623612 [Bactrocera oleae]
MSEIDQDTEISVDGTMWKKLKEGSTPGRLSVLNIFKEMSGPTAYAKRHIMKDAHRILNNHDWTVSLAELNAFILILYTRGAYEAKKKFDIKFWLASDVKSKYVVNAFSYLGKDEKRLSVPLGEFVVLKFIDPYISCGRTVTKKDNMSRFSTVLYKTEKYTLIIYKSNPNKKV